MLFQMLNKKDKPKIGGIWPHHLILYFFVQLKTKQINNIYGHRTLRIIAIQVHVIITDRE